MDEKIIAAIEKLSHVFRSLLWTLAKREHLSPIQIKILVYLANHQERFCAAGQLAGEFNLTKATVSGVIGSLIRKGLIIKEQLPDDRRIFTLLLTRKGGKKVKRLYTWSQEMTKHMEQFSLRDREEVIIFLMRFINSLYEAGLISVARMCINCNNFQRNVHIGSAKPHHCRLTGKPISDPELNIDCQRHTDRILHPLYNTKRRLQEAV